VQCRFQFAFNISVQDKWSASLSEGTFDNVSMWMGGKVSILAWSSQAQTFLPVPEAARSKAPRNAKKAILQAACGRLPKTGLGAATAKKSPEGAGMPRGTLFTHFANKDKLLN